MITFTTNQWIILALVLVAGWLLGMMSRSGGAKWRAKYEAEHDLHTRLRSDHDTLQKQHATLIEARPVERHITATETRPATTTETHVSRDGHRTVVTRD